MNVLKKCFKKKIVMNFGNDDEYLLIIYVELCYF